MATKNLIRSQNTSRIVAALFHHHQAFASELANELGLSIVTTNALLKTLVDDKIVTQTPLVARAIGRPATNYAFNYQSETHLLMTIQEEHNHLTIKATACDMAGIALKPTICVDFSDCQSDTFVQAIQQAIHLAPTAAALGIAFPGKIDQGIVQSSWNERFDGWDLNALITSATTIPYFLENDVHMLTVGHCIQARITRESLTVGIYFPQRSMPGISIFTRNTLIEGNHSLAGEAKYTPTLQQNGAPQTDGETAARLVELMVSYNIALAPNHFVIASNGVSARIFQAAIDASRDLRNHPNQFDVEYVQDFELCMQLGLRWLIYADTPYAL